MGVARTVTVLLVSDDPAVEAGLRQALADAGYDVRSAPDGLAAERALVDRPPAVLVVDMLLPGLSGFALAGRAKDLSAGRTRVVMLAAGPPAALRDYAFAAGVDVLLPKPPPPAALLDAVAPAAPRPTARIGPAAPAPLAPAR